MGKATALGERPPRWQGCADSNRRPSVLETDALPTELHPCIAADAPFIEAARLKQRAIFATHDRVSRSFRWCSTLCRDILPPDMHAPHHPPIPVETLLLAYRSGIFPMSDRREDNEVFWVEPRERAVLPLDGLHLSKSLRKVIRADRFAITVNQAFEQVIRACAQPRPGHPETWISECIVQSYVGLHRSGHAHSIECWLPGDAGNDSRQLVGGLYGVSFDRVFCGESMFSTADNASKVSLAWLVAILRHAGYALLDCQFMTNHLRSMGAIEIPQPRYLKLVHQAGGAPRTSLGTAWRTFARPGEEAADYSSPGKAIVQSLTQTS
jgi:leucyl/phenylalanyl-tRNA---protein transferase